MALKSPSKRSSFHANPFEPHISLPMCEDAEKALCGSILHSPQILDELPEVTEDYFHNPAYKALYSALREMRTEREQINIITLTSHLSDRGNLGTVGGAECVTGCFSDIPTGENYESYVKILKFKMIQRKGITGLTSAIEEIRSSVEVQEVFDATNKSCSEITIACEDKKEFDWHLESIKEFVAEVEACMKGEKRGDFIPTPFETLNKEVYGLCKGELLTIVGMDSSGKSLLGMQFLCESVFNKGECGAIFTMEMPAKQYQSRLTSYLGNISLKRMREGTMNKGEYARFMPTIDRIHKAALHVFDTKRCPMTPEAIEAEIRRLARNNGLSTVMVDYLQLIRIKRVKDIRHDQQLGYISAMLKGLAVELGLRVILIASENKDGNVRDSGNIDYDTDCLLRMVCDNDKVLEKLWIGKWRVGKRGWSIPMNLQGEYCKIEESHP